MSSGRDQILIRGPICPGPERIVGKAFQLPPKSCDHVLFLKVVGADGEISIDIEHSPNGVDWFPIMSHQMDKGTHMVNCPSTITRDIRVIIGCDDLVTAELVEATVMYRA